MGKTKKRFFIHTTKWRTQQSGQREIIRGQGRDPGECEQILRGNLVGQAQPVRA